MNYEYRITKYDPNERNEHGYYSSDYDHWTDYGDIGEIFQEKVLTVAEYLLVEQHYINAIITIMRRGGIQQFRLKLFCKDDELFDENTSSEMKDVFEKLSDNEIILLLDIPALVQLILRDYVGAHLENENMFVHFGYDYYMFVGVNFECQDVLEEIEQSGLFVEEYRSPFSIIAELEELERMAEED